MTETDTTKDENKAPVGVGLGWPEGALRLWSNGAGEPDLEFNLDACRYNKWLPGLGPST
jgi:hypothetical protein